MNKEDFRIVFMGTPEFAVASLKGLVEAGYNVVGVVTAADKPAGRGKKIRHSDIKEYALANNLRLLQPTKFKDEIFLSELRTLKADLQIVVAFRMLPEIVWSMPNKGTFNLHASLLPQYRGAAPINHAIINGETKTGLSTFFLDKEIDTGRIIKQIEVNINEDDDAGKLHDRMMDVGADLVLETVKLIIEGKEGSQDQDIFIKEGELLKPAPKIFKEDCSIKWDKPAKEVYNFIRGLSPFPGAYTSLNSPNKKSVYIKVYSSSYENTAHNLKNGTVLLEKDKMKIVVDDGFVQLHEIQQSGKRRMHVSDFLRGQSLENDYLVE